MKKIIFYTILLAISSYFIGAKAFPDKEIIPDKPVEKTLREKIESDYSGKSPRLFTKQDCNQIIDRYDIICEAAQGNISQYTISGFIDAMDDNGCEFGKINGNPVYCGRLIIGTRENRIKIRDWQKAVEIRYYMNHQ